MYQIGPESAKKLAKCHADFTKIVSLALKRSRVDFGIAEGHRSLERQRELYAQGKTQIDGVRTKGKHNEDPSMAIDVFAYHTDPIIRKKIAYDTHTLCYIAGIMEATAYELYKEGLISHKLRWGGNWDGDGEILTDQSFDDLVHFELIE